MNISILGAGTWGCALARHLRLNGHNIVLWSPKPQHLAKLQATLTHLNLPGIHLPPDLRYTHCLKDACDDTDYLLFSVASPFVRATAQAVKPFLGRQHTILCAAKGIEPDTLLSMTQVINDVLAPQPITLASISGPTHAEEVALGMSTAMMCACRDVTVAQHICDMFSSPCMRMYSTQDILGVELCGALKNVIALAAGMSRGLGMGDNALSALITRGMAEIKRLGLAMNCQSETFESLAGIGDLIVTCYSQHSRNNRAGFLIGQGFTPEEAGQRIGMVIEGFNTLDSAMALADRYNVCMPIINAVYRVVRQGEKAAGAALRLMSR